MIARREKNNKYSPKGNITLHKEISRIKHQKFLLLLLLPGLIALIIFNYIPLSGIILAFKDFLPDKGLYGGPWVGFKYFRLMFAPGSSATFHRSIRNTLIFSTSSLVVSFTTTITFALMINEIMNRTFKKIVQTVSYLPHFLSWVVVAGMTITILSPSIGIYGLIADKLDLKKVVLLTRPIPFFVTVHVSAVWKQIGWSSIIYLAIIAGIDPQLYDAAVIDGAGRFQKVKYITMPGMMPIITLNFVLSAGSILSTNFDQIFNLMNPLVSNIATTLNIYIYRVGLTEGQFSFSTAVGLANSIVAILLVIGSNAIVKKFVNPDYAVW